MRYLFIFFFLISLGLSSQVGGRMREHKNQKRLQRISRTWHFKPTKPGKLQNHWREGRHLYTRNVTSGKKRKQKVQNRINASRNRSRIRGNKVFSKRKYY